MKPEKICNVLGPGAWSIVSTPQMSTDCIVVVCIITRHLHLLPLDVSTCFKFISLPDYKLPWSVLDFAHYWFLAQWLVHRWAQKHLWNECWKAEAGQAFTVWCECVHTWVCAHDASVWMDECVSACVCCSPEGSSSLPTCTCNSATHPQALQLEWCYGDSLVPLRCSPFPKPPGLSTVFPTDPQDQSWRHWGHELTNERGKWWLIEDNE